MNNNLPLAIFKKGSFNVPILSYSITNDELDIVNFSNLARLPHVKDPIIFLPDIHHKPLLETPSSSVVVTHHDFSLSLTSPSQNCGMSLIATPIFEEDLSPLLIERFMSEIKTAIPLKNPSPILSKNEVFQALKRGANWAVEKFGLSKDILDHIENKGNLFGKTVLSVSDIGKTIPDEIIDLARSRFGIIGGGNHFLELQVVDEIIDDAIAKAWGLKQNQIVIMFHTGSDILGAYLGRLYSYRKKTKIRDQLQFYRKKVRYHIVNAPWRSIGKRLNYYFVPKPFRFIDPDITEGKRTLLAVNCAANFGFANRVAIFSAIKRTLEQISTTDNDLEIRLLYDCSHNSIYRENVSGNAVWGHRHNACRVYPPSLLQSHPVFSVTGQPVILPGTNQTSSFICAGREGSVATHFTVDHGLGAIQKRYEKNGSPQKTGEYSLLFNYLKDAPDKIPILNDTAVDSAVEILNQADIICPIARLKPIATLKGPKSKII
jgi:RNA-splicing ligase RtcB